jgi:hypothetical protein
MLRTNSLTAEIHFPATIPPPAKSTGASNAAMTRFHQRGFESPSARTILATYLRLFRSSLT